MELAAQVVTQLSKDNIKTIMHKSPDSWNRISFFIRRAIKKEEERREK